METPVYSNLYDRLIRGEEKLALVGLGYVGMPIAVEFAKHVTAYVSPRAHIGTGCVILNNAVVQNNATCGDGCILNPGVELHHDSTIGSYCLVYTNSVVRSLTMVGDRVWIGSNVTVSTSATVPNDTTVPDGSVCKAEG